MPVNSLYFSNIGPFVELSLDFDSQVNVLTGPNNSGKTVILWALAELLVFPFTMPRKYHRSDDAQWRIDISWDHRSESLEGQFPADVDQFEEIYSHIGHTSFVPAQRHNTRFRSEGPLRIQDEAAQLDKEISDLTQARPELVSQVGEEILRQIVKETMSSASPEVNRRRSLIRTSPSHMSDEPIIQKIIDLDYAAYRLGRPEIRSVVDKLASIASDITRGFPISDLKVVEDTDGLFPQVNVPFGNLPLDVLSQGTQSIVKSLAHFLFGYAEYYDFPTDFEDKPGVLIIDEIDAHLHPSWQRRIIPTLTKHFPSLQIFCSTHSPLMLAGLRAGQVQLLDLHDDATITVSTNESDVFGWTADEILRTFLDIYSPTDLRTSESIRRLEDLDIKEDLSPSEAEELDELHRIISKSLTSGPTSVQVLEFANELRRARDELIHPSGPTSTQEQGTQEGPK